MAASSRSITYNTLLATTADAYYKGQVIQDGVFESNPLFKTLRGKGFKSKENGGDKIRTGLLYGENSTVKSYSGSEELDIAPQDNMTVAFWDWAQYSGAITMDGITKFKNAGASKIQDRLREETTVLTKSFAEVLDQHMLDVENISIGSPSTTANSGKNIQGLPLLVQKDPTASATVGLINQNTTTAWRNRYKDGSGGTTYAALRLILDDMYNTCSRGNDFPDLGMTDQITYQLIESGMDEKVRYTSVDQTASPGFAGIMYKQAKLFWDVFMPDINAGTNGDGSTALTNGTLYFLNSDYLDFIIGEGADFSPRGWEKAYRQDAMTNLYFFYGQLVALNRRHHGVIYKIPVAFA